MHPVNHHVIFDNSDKLDVKIAVMKNIKSLMRSGKYNVEINALNLRKAFSLSNSTLVKEWNEVLEELMRTLVVVS